MPALRFALALFLIALVTTGGEAARLDVAFTDNGAIDRMTVDGHLAAADLGWRLPKPQWHGEHISLNDAHRLQTSPRREGAVQTWSGQGRTPEGVTVAASTQCRRSDDAVEIVYSLTPDADLTAVGPVVTMTMPIAALRGKPYLRARGDEVSRLDFPQQLPANYVLDTGSDFDWCAWPAGNAWVQIEPDWKTIAHTQLQDDRRFGGKTFQLQLYSVAAGRLAAGRPVHLRLTVRAVSKERMARNMEAARRRADLARPQLQGKGRLSIRSVSPSTVTVERLQRAEFQIDFQGEYDNPFDPGQVDMRLELRGPGGTRFVIPAFFAQNYELVSRQPRPRWSAHDRGGWRVRYTPAEVGTYRGAVRATCGAKTVTSEPVTIISRASRRQGFVRVAKGNPLYFEFDDGAPYFAIGENVCWARHVGEYDDYWRRLGENGANYARLWIGPFDLFTLERAPQKGSPWRLGVYDQIAAARIDYVLDEAAKRGIQIMFCIDSFNSLRSRPQHNMWDRCPYNAANGGPCQKPQEFFTHPAAREMFRRRLRYIVARWGACANLLSWEFWNEVNIIDSYDSQKVAAWHREMGDFLRAIDPYHHLVTTSYAGPAGDPAVDGLPQIDYVQSHHYGAHDFADFVHRINLQKVARYGKPHYFGEFGTGTRAEGTLEDVDGIHLHNGLWSSLTSLGAGTAMLWWWDNYIRPRNLYFHFKPIAQFVAGVPFNKRPFRSSTIADLRYVTPPKNPPLSDLHLAPDRGSWQPAPFNKPVTVTVHRDGSLEGGNLLPRVLHGLINHKDLHNPVTFVVDCPAAGRFLVSVTGVSGYGGAGLTIRLDGKTVLDKEFIDDSEDTKTMSQFNGDYGIDVPAGKHRIQVENRGRDWFFAAYELTRYVVRDKPNLRVYGIDDGSMALVWVQNRDHNWFHHNQGKELTPVPPSRFRIASLRAGGYRVQRWDTWTGQSHDMGVMTANGEGLELQTEAVTRDLAFRIESAAVKSR